MDTPDKARTNTLADEQTVCYRHPDVPTRLRCSRCDVPICGACATPASVGQHCPECVSDARRSAPRVRSAIRATAPAVYAILILNAIVFVAQLLLGGGFTQEYALVPVRVHSGEYYRLVTAMFLHSPEFFLHILFNSYVLYWVGPQVEEAFGTRRFIPLYLIAGIAGSAASYAFSQCLISGRGASGAIFGIAGVLAVFVYNRRDSLVMAQYLRSIFFFIGINVVLGFLIQGIDNAAHLGGLAAGVALGLGFDQGRKGQHASTRIQVITALGVLGAALALVAYRTATFSCGPPGLL